MPTGAHTWSIRLAQTSPCFNHTIPPPSSTLSFPLSPFPQIVPCSPALLAGTLQAAVESQYPQWLPPKLGQRRVVVLSGMYGSEVVEVVSAYRDSGEGALVPLACCQLVAAESKDQRRRSESRI